MFTIVLLIQFCFFSLSFSQSVVHSFTAKLNEDEETLTLFQTADTMCTIENMCTAL